MTGTSHATLAPPPAFTAVLLDWRGTLVVAPTFPWWVRTALGRLGRDSGTAAVDAVLGRLRRADHAQVDSSQIDTDAAAHHDAYAQWCRDAGLDDELSRELYAVECDVRLNEFAHDVGPVLLALHEAGVTVGVVSDIHVDIRPHFADQRLPDGRRWADLVDVWALSFELGVAKPDPAIFLAALERLGVPASEVLMVGDRGAWDGAAADVGITTLIVPALTAVTELRLSRVLDLVLPGRAGGRRL